MHLIDEVGLGASDEGHLSLRQLGKRLNLGETEVKDQQTSGLQCSQYLGKETLVMGFGVFFWSLYVSCKSRPA